LAKREADARKKARDLNTKVRKAEEELETANDQRESQESETAQLKASLSKLEARLATAEKDAKEARADLERERKDFEATAQSRIEEEKNKWRSEVGSVPGTPGLDSSHSALLRAESSLSLSQRKQSAPEVVGSMRRSHTGRGTHGSDLPLLFSGHFSPDHSKPPSSRRGAPHYFAGPVRTPTDPASLASRGDFASPTTSPPLHSGPNGANNAPPPIVPVADDLPTPSIHTAEVGDDDRDTLRSSPQRTAAELVSVSTAGAGPSVQLVERMSATVRRLEMEKAASREEIARLLTQRDEARNEVVALMREVEGVNETKDRVASVEKEMGELKSRYDAALEMLGEKSEECEELKNDVQDLKKIYRELVESTLK
jgi:TATA element modulatory factor